MKVELSARAQREMQRIDAWWREHVELMRALKAHVENGRIVVDELTTLPEGAELSIVIADGSDELDAEERERLHASIERGIADVRAGREKDFDQFLDELDADYLSA